MKQDPRQNLQHRPYEAARAKIKSKGVGGMSELRRAEAGPSIPAQHARSPTRLVPLPHALLNRSITSHIAVYWSVNTGPSQSQDPNG